MICAGCRGLLNRRENRMGGRVVEGTGLENRQGRESLVGSNPTPSASCPQISTVQRGPARAFSPSILPHFPLHLTTRGHSTFGRIRPGRAVDSRGQLGATLRCVAPFR